MNRRDFLGTNTLVLAGGTLAAPGSLTAAEPAPAIPVKVSRDIIPSREIPQECEPSRHAPYS